MKKLFILFSAAFLFSCSDTKDKNKTDDPPNSKPDKPAKVIEKKPATEQKKDLVDLFNQKKADDVTSDDKSGWTEERKQELISFCMQDMEGTEEADGKAFCSCQLDNLMKIFPSYVEAMNLFNNMEEEGDNISDDQMEKAEKMMNANENCIDQLMKKYNQGNDENDEEMDDAEESGRKKKNP